MAHQRLAARLLALRTQQLENKLSQMSDDHVTANDVGDLGDSKEMDDRLSRMSDDRATANNVGHLGDGNEAEDKLSRVLENCVTANDSLSLQKSNVVEDKLSQASHNSVTPADVSGLDENNELDASNQSEKFNCLQFDHNSAYVAGANISSRLAHSNDAVGLAVSWDESSVDKNAVILETGSHFT